MSVRVDGVGVWQQLGEIVASDRWRIFPVPTSSQIFRFTTTVENLQDWNTNKIKSASFIRFYYPNGSVSSRIYQPVIDKPIIQELPTIGEIKIPRYIGCILSSPLLKVGVPLERFAVWRLKIEGLI